MPGCIYEAVHHLGHQVHDLQVQLNALQLHGHVQDAINDQVQQELSDLRALISGNNPAPILQAIDRAPSRPNRGPVTPAWLPQTFAYSAHLAGTH